MGSAVDRAAATLAARQSGVFAHRQLVRLGVSPAAIGRRRRAGLWITHHRGVYGLAGAPLGARGRAVAALLSGGPRAAISHRAAAADHRIRAYTPPMEITVPGPRRRSRPDLLIHTQPPFAEGDITVRAGIRVTSPVRTLLDLAGCSPLKSSGQRRRRTRGAPASPHSSRPSTTSPAPPPRASWSGRCCG